MIKSERARAARPDEVPVQDCVLEVRCEVCDGTGVSYGSLCPQCNATGLAMTEQGEKILRFVAKRLSLSVSSD